MHRSFRPSDFRWRDAPFIVCMIIIFSLIVSGGESLLNGRLEGFWLLAIGLSCFLLFLAGAALRGYRQHHAGHRERKPMDPADYEPFMRRCILLAGMAREQGNTPVGSVVVLDGEIIGEATETLPKESSITGHAEILACQYAVDSTGRNDLAGAVLYTTAEPCFMCSYAIRQLRIDRVIYGIETPVIGGSTSSHPILTDPGLDGWRKAPKVIGGVLHEECERLKVKTESKYTKLP